MPSTVRVKIWITPPIASAPYRLLIGPRTISMRWIWLGGIAWNAVVPVVAEPILSPSTSTSTWLGLVPRQHSTGGKERLLGISKRGDSYLRKLLVHGARTTIRWVGRKTDRRSQWIRQLVERRGKNRTAVAVANKNAQIVWALLTSHQDYQLATG